MTSGEGSDKATGLFNQTEFNNFSYPTALEFNPNKMLQADRDHLSKLGVTDKDIQDAQQGRYENETSLSGPKEARGFRVKKVRVDIRSRKMTTSAETSQSTKEPHQGEQDKGIEHPASYEEQIANLRAAMEELKANRNPNPELTERARKLLAESQQPSEQETRQARRRLDTPDNQCLDISQTQISANSTRAVANPDGYGLELDIQGVLQNNCGSQVSDVHYNMNV